MDKLLLGILGMLLIVVLHNPFSNAIANMSGPHFLVFYSLIIAVILFANYRSVNHDSTAKLPLPLIPHQPDPYEIAYLRGGEYELARLVVVNLIHKGYLQVTDNEIRGVDNQSDLYDLSSLERQVFHYFLSPKPINNVFNSSFLSQITRHCSVYERQLINNQLLLPETDKEIIRWMRKYGTLIILGLGLYKLLVALLKGYTNVWFLIIMGITSLIILISISHPPRLSKKGRAYLNSIQETFAQLKRKIFNITPDEAEFNSLLPIAIFGTGVLAGTAYAGLNQMSPKPLTQAGKASNNSGSSCGGGGCAGANSCSSSSSCSSGSSCGSSCGGGGCGGCGGG